MRNLTSLIVMIMFMLNDELASASTVAETMGGMSVTPSLPRAPI